MDDSLMNPLKTGVMFVAPGQIMDPLIMRPSHRPDHLSRLKADMGLDAVEAALAPVAQRSWSFRRLLERLWGNSLRNLPSPT